MVRTSLPKYVETEVLISSRRRCCICFGLNRDTRIANGQIAHLDKNNSNHKLENLAFLCFDHHDEFDSTSSQRKNLTTGEVKKFRDELYVHINKAFTQRVHFGEITTPPEDPYAGSWIRLGTASDSAEIKITPLPEDMEGRILYYISGMALWGVDREFGPNLGELGYVALLIESESYIISIDSLVNNDPEIILEFDSNNNLRVKESFEIGTLGAGVTFNGIYRREAEIF